MVFSTHVKKAVSIIQSNTIQSVIFMDEVYDPVEQGAKVIRKDL
jgi:hypothetical protein